MNKQRKIFQRILTGSKNIRFADFVAVIEAFGFVLLRISGSHHIFSHPHVPQTISAQPDQNNQAKSYQLKQFVKLVEKYALEFVEDENDREELE